MFVCDLGVVVSGGVAVVVGCDGTAVGCDVVDGVAVYVVVDVVVAAGVVVGFAVTVVVVVWCLHLQRIVVHCWC